MFPNLSLSTHFIAFCPRPHTNQKDSKKTPMMYRCLPLNSKKKNQENLWGGKLISHQFQANWHMRVSYSYECDFHRTLNYPGIQIIHIWIMWEVPVQWLANCVMPNRLRLLWWPIQWCTLNSNPFFSSDSLELRSFPNFPNLFALQRCFGVLHSAQVFDKRCRLFSCWMVVVANVARNFRLVHKMSLVFSGDNSQLFCGPCIPKFFGQPRMRCPWTTAIFMQFWLWK